MFGFFRRKRENGAAAHKLDAPRLSAELKAMQDREFAERLHRSLLEKNGGADGAKIEPRFKTGAARKPSPASQPAPPVRPGDERAKRDEAPKSDARPKAPPSPLPAAPLNPEADHLAVKANPAAAPATQPAPSGEEQPAAQTASALPLVMRAAHFAAERHKNQRRRGAAREPYVNHLLEVAAMLATATEGRDPDLVTAGVLHDLIEDQGVSADDVARQFGVGVAALVLEVTTDKSLSEAERRRLQVTEAAHKSPRARMLRIADLTSNLRALRQSPPADWPHERQRDYFRWAREVVSGSRGVNVQLESAFDDAYAAGPAVPSTAPERPSAA